MNYKIYNGDCLKEHINIPDESVDLILTDLPYGTMKSAGRSKEKWSKKTCFRKDPFEWDNIIDTNAIKGIASRILKPNRKMLLFSQQPFTTELIKKTYEGIEHCYQLFWEKNHHGNPLQAKTAPLSYIEEICVFKKQYSRLSNKELRAYSETIRKYIGKTPRQVAAILKHKGAQHFLTHDGLQFSLPTKKTYEELIKNFYIDKMPGFIKYEDLIKDATNKQIFNLWEGKNYKSNLLKYHKAPQKIHPTAKPVDLLEDLIKTYTHEGMTVCDLTMGSGSTGVAAMNCNRSFIGIELKQEYYDIAEKRIKEAFEKQHIQ